MNFELDDEQTMLRDTTRELLNRSYDAEKRNDTSATDEGWNAAVWKQFAELGLLGLPFAEADGGMGAGPVETMVVMTELGRALAPEPYLGGVLIPGGLIAAVGSADQRARLLPALSDGTTLSAFAHTEPGTRWPVATVTTTASQSSSSPLHVSTGAAQVPHVQLAPQDRAPVEPQLVVQICVVPAQQVKPLSQPSTQSSSSPLQISPGGEHALGRTVLKQQLA